MKSVQASILIIILSLIQLSHTFVIPSQTTTTTIKTTSKTTTTSSLFVFGKKKKPETEDLSYIESRDLTREEMLEINKQNEEIMNMELTMMTGFSLVLSLPIFYLCWVAFY